MSHRVIHSDCIEALRAMPDASVDAVVCDPPYAIGFMGRSWDTFKGEPIDPAFLHWFAGFVDGEGCFHIKRANGAGFSCEFYLQLRADDRPILERIQRTLGIGRVSDQDRGHDQNPMARFVVGRKAECTRLRDVFRDFPLRAKKARDFQAWSEALDAWIDHEPGDGWEEAAAAHAKLRDLREFKPEGVRVDPFQMWCVTWGREALRVLKPGGHLAAFGGTRAYHRLAAGLEDAGFEIRDSLHWLMGSGFPKSLDVSKAIDAHLGAERPVIGTAKGAGSSRTESLGEFRPVYAATAPATAPATAWNGWGTALKPAHEPIVLARKPLAGTVAANVLEHGTGGLNVDATRIPFASYGDKAAAAAERACQDQNAGRTVLGRFENGPASLAPYLAGMDKGRWPPNVLLTHSPECRGECASGCPVAELDRQSGDTQSGSGSGGIWSPSTGSPAGDQYGDFGGASRFFPVFRYVAKPARAERDVGLHDLPERTAGEATDREDGSEGLRSPRAGAGRTGGARNIHPTVKPVALMEWLVRLVTPKGGTVLDPFLGSGTTGMAAVRQGFEFIGIEREAEYVEIAERRIALAANAPRSKPLGSLERADEPDPRQPSLFGDAA